MSKINKEEHNICPIGPPPWRYKCRDCGQAFEMPAPRGPTEERNRACPGCHSRNIERLNIENPEACPPGG